MPHCAVSSCHRKTRVKASISYHRFPVDHAQRQLWIGLCGRNIPFNVNSSRICSRHFSNESYDRAIVRDKKFAFRSRLRKDALPNLNLPVSSKQVEQVTFKDYVTRVGARFVVRGKGGLRKKAALQPLINHFIAKARRAYPILSAVGLISKTAAKKLLTINNMLLMDTPNDNPLPQLGLDKTDLSSPNEFAKTAQPLTDQSNQPDHDTNSLDNATNNLSADRDTTADCGDKDTKNWQAYLRENVTVKSVNKRGLDENSSSTDEESTQSKKIKLLPQDAQIAHVANDAINGCSTTQVNDIAKEIQNGDTDEKPLHEIERQLTDELIKLDFLIMEKENEWNALISLKKQKEALLLQAQRKHAVQKALDRKTNVDELSLNTHLKSLQAIHYQANDFMQENGVTIIPICKNVAKDASRMNGGGGNDYRQKQRVILPKPEMTNGKLGPKGQLVDVHAILQDYRQSHPEDHLVRRGRRIKNTRVNQMSQVNNQQQRRRILPIINANNAANAQFQSRANTDLEIMLTPESNALLNQQAEINAALLNNLMQMQKGLSEANTQNASGSLPEVTLHPVPTSTSSTVASSNIISRNSLLHGILTKGDASNTKSPAVTSAPTLARLLTSTNTQANTYAASEITRVKQLQDKMMRRPMATHETNDSLQIETDGDASNDSTLIIDEMASRKYDNERVDASGDDDVTPECHVCKNPSQFVCAGCTKQSYCSRECQIAHWDQHSQTCTG